MQAGGSELVIDQSISRSVALLSAAPRMWMTTGHFEAWKQGVKTLYYTRTESVLRGDIAQQAMDPDCISCDG